jgi:glutamyl-tRNA synthetase
MMTAEPQHIARHVSPHLGRLGIDPCDGPDLAAVVREHVARVQTLAELAAASAYCYQDFDQYDKKSAKNHLRPVARAPLENAQQALTALSEWTPEAIQQAVAEVASKLELALSKVAQPLRVAVAGRAASPAIDITLALVGKGATLRRIERALEFIRKRAGTN